MAGSEGQLTVESPDFENIKRETGVNTMDAIHTLWLVANDEAKSRRQGVRQAIERQNPKEIIIDLAVSQNDYDTEFATVLRSNGAASVNITGFLAKPEPTFIYLCVLGTGTITLKHNSASSEEVNRILSYTGADVAVAPNQAIRLVYLNSRWRYLQWL